MPSFLISSHLNTWDSVIAYSLCPCVEYFHFPALPFLPPTSSCASNAEFVCGLSLCSLYSCFISLIDDLGTISCSRGCGCCNLSLLFFLLQWILLVSDNYCIFDSPSFLSFSGCKFFCWTSCSTHYRHCLMFVVLLESFQTTDRIKKSQNYRRREKRRKWEEK